ncbi:GTP pyrophosphokinase family protein [uncultured Acetatifactor sp.]|uniref:GTP pyrophosphokinase n=1 Tax=uncultured Acetatifactor sp. TaxID=1671927 RepID=UPI0025DB03C0|nr:GTP pyrophosphokinase family protein [uncultured Acetatifactor sp.]MCI8695691.1 GTP pyrophosphokinase family protein [Lachnospiraceae bacterium]MCI9230424.1 GTP pyrophosphokinase family protein [Lachnospiraceae bacterium]MCI9572362.1 GTP pyrophosphokinase family protein [Lachnospiraceae bacterium]
MNENENENMEVNGIPLGFPVSFMQIKEMTMLYSCAMREICTKLENLSQEFELKEARNPIQHINHRLKKTESIRNKMLQKGLPLEYEVMRDEITDIGGIRVICSYINDIYAIANMLKQQDDLLIVREKDYISNPKKNGYRSYHLIVAIPIFLSSEKQIIPVEIQMRTIAMDFWASLEHQLRYKTTASVSDSTRSRLTNIAQDIFRADVEMQQIYEDISALE